MSLLAESVHGKYGDSHATRDRGYSARNPSLWSVVFAFCFFMANSHL